MFLEWRVDIRPHVREGANDLLIVFHSPIKAAAQAAALDPWSRKTTVAEKAYLRKAAYMYGWDWGPRFASSGIWKPVRLEAWDNLRISDFSIRQREVTSEVANLTAEVDIQAASPGPATVAVSCDRTEAVSYTHLACHRSPGRLLQKRQFQSPGQSANGNQGYGLGRSRRS